MQQTNATGQGLAQDDLLSQTSANNFFSTANVDSKKEDSQQAARNQRNNTKAHIVGSPTSLGGGGSHKSKRSPLATNKEILQAI